MKNSEKGLCPIKSSINTILLSIILIGGAVLGTCLYAKVNDIQTKGNQAYNFLVANFGGSEYFSEMADILASDAFLATVKDSAKESLDQMRAQFPVNSWTTEGTDDVDSTQDTSASVIVAKGLSDPRWEANASEAFSHFQLQGTPGNAVINVKTGKFQAVGGAYPKDIFEGVITALKTGKGIEAFAQLGHSGTLTAEQIATITKDAYFYGNADADILIVEYSDLLCPYCQRHYNDKTLESIVDADAKVAMIFKNNPIAQLHPTAPIGARGAECAGELGGTDAYYKYIGEAFSYQTFTAKNVVEIAEKVGLSGEDFVACFNA